MVQAPSFLVGFAFLLGSSDSDRGPDSVLMLHLPLLGLLAWEWQGALGRRQVVQVVVASLAAPSMDDEQRSS